MGHFMADEAPDLLRERVLGFLGYLKERWARLDSRGVTDATSAVLHDQAPASTSPLKNSMSAL